MEVKRVENPAIIKYLRPYFIDDGSYTREIIAKELFDIMISAPDKIFVVVIFEKNELYGFVIGFIPDNREYIWMAEVWSKPGSDRKYGREAINMIKQWAIDEHNIHEIRFETGRNPKAVERAWGFSTHATVMNCKF